MLDKPIAQQFEELRRQPLPDESLAPMEDRMEQSEGATLEGDLATEWRFMVDSA